jgi:hypothetical protein
LGLQRLIKIEGKTCFNRISIAFDCRSDGLYLLFQALCNQNITQQSIGGVVGEGNRVRRGETKGKTEQFYFVYVSRDRLINELRVSLEAEHQSTVSSMEQSKTCSGDGGSKVQLFVCLG